MCFLCLFLNIIDLVVILFYYIIFGLFVSGGDEFGNILYVVFFCIFWLVWVFRIFKLFRYYCGLKIFGMMLRVSFWEFFLLFFFLFMGVIIFFSGVYYVESVNFGSIFEVFWWFVVIMIMVSFCLIIFIIF